jgi:hypothetical protein
VRTSGRTSYLSSSVRATTLIARASSHEDAHFAKYTLACLIVCSRDPAASPCIHRRGGIACRVVGDDESRLWRLR